MVSLNDINGDESPKSSFADFKSGKEEYSIAALHTQNSTFRFLEFQFKLFKREKDASCEYHIKTKWGLQ